jgi:hypothetical protein
MEYKASLDTFAKIITIAALLLFIYIGYRSVKAIFVAGGNSTAILLHSGILFFLVCTVLLCWLYRPQKYVLEKNELVIVRTIKERRINIDDITEIRAVARGELSGTIRTFGVGGMFGYFGLYYNSKLGSMTWYITQRKNRVLIRTKTGDKIIISPDDLSLIENVKTMNQNLH